MRDFDSEMAKLQVHWRAEHIDTAECGVQNGVARPWILPASRWQDGLWPPLRGDGAHSVPTYLRERRVQRHAGSHNLKSSWISGVNTYFPFGQSESGRALLAAFLASRVDDRVRSVGSIELEWAAEGELSPSVLLGEEGGSRGSGQTSPDLAFPVNGEAGLLLVENKLTEDSFYPCSARRSTGSPARPANPDTSRCERVGALIEDVSMCHQQTWGRKYWERLQGAVDVERLSRLPRCPAAKAGYQLFRQQALAEALATSGCYEFVVSAVALDARNERLAACLRSSGIPDVRAWSELFRGKSSFAVFTHQEWAAWVRANDEAGEWRGWANWMASRYGV
jgi:hypothetical protein